ncbi:hypothetical protein DPMN_114988 [Dreissena polymorpha]|uniref:Uncharacterized protein n=1 Tax=Dreissena polymorpha TaxID=45954 RepID=A0A9D4KKG9_DREPO|nr:hypothetical protein DPMN_114988 [Dreissena polymorpha]
MDKRSSDVVSPPRLDPGCPPGWVGYRWACYMVADAIRTWQQSKINCYTLSGVLLRIDDRWAFFHVQCTLNIYIYEKKEKKQQQHCSSK